MAKVELVSIVREAIDKLDPEGLLLKCPFDEYMPEAEIFAGFIEKNELITKAMVSRAWEWEFSHKLSDNLLKVLTSALVKVQDNYKGME